MFVCVCKSAKMIVFVIECQPNRIRLFKIRNLFSCKNSIENELILFPSIFVRIKSHHILYMIGSGQIFVLIANQIRAHIQIDKFDQNETNRLGKRFTSILTFT